MHRIDELIFVIIFVIIFVGSCHELAKLLGNQRLEGWLTWHVEAFELFGSGSALMVTNNSEAARIRATIDALAKSILDRSPGDRARRRSVLFVGKPPPLDFDGEGDMKHDFLATNDEERGAKMIIARLIRAGQRGTGPPASGGLEHLGLVHGVPISWASSRTTFNGTQRCTPLTN